MATSTTDEDEDRDVLERSVPPDRLCSTSTDWGLFHRIDVAMKKAIRASPAALEVFDIGQAMGALFGVGEGRVILRGCAELMAGVGYVDAA